MKKKSYLLLLSIFLMGISLLVACGEAEDAKEEQNQEVAVEIETIATDELKEVYDDEGWRVVDTRINDAYNGWAVDGVERGGHIEGATDFAANWLEVEADDKEDILDKALETKGITLEKNVVLYDTNGSDARAVAEYLSQKGFENLYVYDANEWIEDESLPMASYEDYEMIVPASWLKDVIDSDNDEKPFKVFEVSWGEESEDYNAGHIPGAVHINTDDFEEAPIWNRLSDEELEASALKYGITTDMTVILYGADSMPSYRVATILKYMGVEDVRVLNGGYGAWTRAGYEVETDKKEAESVESFGAEIPVNSEHIIDLSGAREIIADSEGSVLVDIRSWVEHTGETSGYDYIEAKGRPDGAIWGYAGEGSSGLEDFRNIDGTMRNGYEIEAMWEELGITRDKNLSFFCGTGWRAAEVLFYADALGFDRVSLYDGGWKEWGEGDEISDNPVADGEPEIKPEGM